MRAGGWDVPSRTVCPNQSVPGVTTVLAGQRGTARNGKPQQMFFLSSLLAFLSAPLAADTREGHKCWTVPLLSMDWFCCETLAFHMKGVQSCLLSGHSED